MNPTNKDFPPLPPPGTYKQAMQNAKVTNVVGSTNSLEPWSLTILMDYSSFKDHFVWRKQLGAGGDGTVSEYFYKSNWKATIAVKHPKEGSHSSKKNMMSEIRMMMTLGQHGNINSMLSYCGNFEPISPAIFFEVCDLGDVHCYTRNWHEQQRQAKKNPRIPEVTVLKLMRDVVSALDFLHNGHDGICYVHNDLKPDNILVLTPPGYEGKGMPTEPIFKITDFARSTKYPTPSKDKPGKWSGTPEYAPPEEERAGVPKPSVDMWGLAATVQSVALNALPVQSKDAFVLSRIRLGKTYPPNRKDGWDLTQWRDLRPVVYRPLNVTQGELQEHWDLAGGWSSHHPYSNTLNNWYRMLFDDNSVTRITSAHFMKYVMPLLEKQMLIAKKLALAKSAFEQVRLLQEQAKIEAATDMDVHMQDVD